MDDADAELQDRIDKRSAAIILRAARRLRGMQESGTFNVRSSKGVRDGRMKAYCL
jgi:hypothetical protein